MTTSTPTPENTPICPDCGQPQSFRGVMDMGTGKAFDYFHCIDETCELFERTLTYNQRVAPITNARMLARMATEAA